MRLLIIEDEPKTRAYLHKGLTEAGFVIDLAATGPDGLHLAQTGDYDLILLDVMLPGFDGWSVLKALRQESRHTPVLYLTARDGVEDRVRGLELGADDYLVKPFAFAELLARIRSVLRRGSMRAPEIIVVDDLELDLVKRRVRRGGVRIELTAREFGLLELLMRRQGEVLSRATIASQVWDINFDSETNAIDVAVKRLRAKIEEPPARKLIHTVRGMGYVLEDRER